LAFPLEELLVDVPARLSIHLLPILPAHVVKVASLPVHHRDPFDRLLIAQCMVERIPLVSADPVVDAYGVERIW
jgi:PIN domain nuclease of toxin-antitoxin system